MCAEQMRSLSQLLNMPHPAPLSFCVDLLSVYTVLGLAPGPEWAALGWGLGGIQPMIGDAVTAVWAKCHAGIHMGHPGGTWVGTSCCLPRGRDS